ncbi:MAG: hypothetical protein A2Y88_07285 [Chloroflexi bacterium RBG_13_48_10]|nr:MAG: hypothetical protein A2Y88_07285 [Chloroflexi bacterium RBG_13_48_10]
MITNYEYSLIGNMSPRMNETNLRLEAVKSFNLALNRGKLGQLWSKILGKENHLHALSSQPISSDRPTNRITSIAIRQIKGSLGRSDEFDTNFNPLQERSRSRWINVASAIRMGIPLPSVELVQVEDTYYVRDGHHRISVAKSLGQEVIDARIVS